jgi:hypothetical protein
VDLVRHAGDPLSKRPVSGQLVTISRRLWHAKPNVTLAIYAHMFHTDDRKAAAAINAAFGE